MLPLSHPPEKYQSVVCNSVLHDEEIQLPFRRPLTTALLQIVGGDKLIIPFC